MKNFTIIGSVAHLFRKGLYAVSYILDTKVLNRRDLVSIFCYHSIADNTWRFTVTPEMFKKQVQSLIDDGFAFISLKDIEGYIKGTKNITKPSVHICFDDGYEGLLEIAPFLLKLGIKPSVFVLSDRDHANRAELDNGQRVLEIAEIKQLRDYGWEIGSHTATHPDMLSLSENDLQKEVIDSKKQLEKDLGTNISYIAYPKGRYTSEVLSMVKKAGYSLGLSMDDGIITKNSPLFAVPRIGIEKSHSLIEFKGSGTLLALYTRKVIKKTPLKHFL